MEKISIVVSCFNEEKTLPLFYEEIEKVNIDNVLFEYIFVDDGSSDNSLNIIKDLSDKDDRVKYISFSRNFGKEAAMYAGIKNASGDYVCVMDCDLQDPPQLLREMYSIIKNDDYDCVSTRRITRAGEPIIKSLLSKMFYKLINKMSDTEIVDGARDFRLMSRKMTDSIIPMKEYNRFSKGLFSFVGFKTKWIEYENVERVAGTSKWNFHKLFWYAIEGIVAFSTKPLIFSAFIGILLCIFSFFAILFIIFKTLMFGDPVGGWPSLVCILFFLSGIQLFCIGIVGIYLAKMYMEVKNRPIYITRETNISKEKCEK